MWKELCSLVCVESVCGQKADVCSSSNIRGQNSGLMNRAFFSRMGTTMCKWPYLSWRMLFLSSISITFTIVFNPSHVLGRDNTHPLSETLIAVSSAIAWFILPAPRSQSPHLFLLTSLKRVIKVLILFKREMSGSFFGQVTIKLLSGNPRVRM